MNQEIWTFKYEPQTLEEMILTNENRKALENVIQKVPNVLLYGSPGIGKGTFMNIFLKETGYDYLKINASDENSIDDIRTKVKSFATSLGTTEKKIVYLNEGDFLSIAGQSSLREIVESVQKHTRFAFLVNYPHKIIDPLKSRCQSICLNDPPATQIFKFLMGILNKEGIKVQNKEAIVGMIKKLYPDIRQMINTLQLNSSTGVLSSIKVSSTGDLYQKVFDSMKNHDIEGVRKILRSETLDYSALFKSMYEQAGNVKVPGEWVVQIGEYLYRDSIVSIKEINFMAFFMNCVKQGII